MEYQNSPLNLIKKEDKKTNRRSSFFNVNPSEEEKKEADRQYLKSLLAERADWIEIIRSNQKKIKKAKSKELPVYDSSILDEEKKKFLEGAIDVQQYVKDRKDFLHKVLVYTKKKEWQQKCANFQHELEAERVLEKTLQNLKPLD